MQANARLTSPAAAGTTFGGEGRKRSSETSSATALARGVQVDSSYAVASRMAAAGSATRSLAAALVEPSDKSWIKASLAAATWINQSPLPPTRSVMGGYICRAIFSFLRPLRFWTLI